MITVVLGLVAIAMAVAVVVWVLVAVKGTADEYLHSTVYEVDKMLSEVERDYEEFRERVETLCEEMRTCLGRYEKSVERLVGVIWPDLTEKEKNILSLYLRGYNKSEIAERTGVPLELVDAVLALRVGDGDA